MTKNWCDRCVKLVVYYVIFSNILLPMLLLFINDPNSCISFSDILTSIVWIVSGILLLIGQGKVHTDLRHVDDGVFARGACLLGCVPWRWSFLTVSTCFINKWPKLTNPLIYTPPHKATKTALYKHQKTTAGGRKRSFKCVGNKVYFKSPMFSVDTSCFSAGMGLEVQILRFEEAFLKRLTECVHWVFFLLG
ncbi:uncharacterized protein LOC135140947 isoform X2 [Zophobas morio]|uniref:uncharacterized protein LOC135140947 isoform X2 n=1 Tax=Zophobas morio TaxID=2755281 RepID=UPI0030832D07